MNKNTVNLMINLNAVLNHVKQDVKPLILIGGCSRSGKSTFTEALAGEIRNQGHETLVISADMWLYPASLRKFNSSVMERYRIGELIDCLNLIQSGSPVNVKPYNAITRELENFSCTIKPPKTKFIVLLEGVIALCVNELRSKSFFNIYVDLDDKTRLKRLILFYRNNKLMNKADYRVLIREREIEEVIFIKKSAIYADFIYRNKKNLNTLVK
jgi:uridine kinase